MSEIEISPDRCSPLHAVTAFATTRWSARNRMRVPAAMGESGPAMPVWLRDVSHSWRFGFKGAGAPGWCAAQGLPLPAQPNTYALLDGGGLVARLAHTEFYVEHEEEQRIGGLREALGRGVQAAGGGVYPVHRCDAGILLGGPLARDVLLQTCNVNFAAIDMAAAPVIMTLIVGVAVTVLPMQEGGQVVYRMACDPTFAPCLWTTLAGIAAESGGGPIATAT